jgi:hypothetical protein
MLHHALRLFHWLMSQTQVRVLLYECSVFMLTFWSETQKKSLEKPFLGLGIYYIAKTDTTTRKRLPPRELMHARILLALGQESAV